MDNEVIVMSKSITKSETSNVVGLDPKPILTDPVKVAGVTGIPRATSDATNVTNSGAWCRTYRFPVKMSPTSTDCYEVFGDFCTNQPLTDETTVQILLAGGSNNTTYWDWPLDPDNHSYVRHATRSGFAVLNVDRLGYGKSDHPDPTKIDFPVGGYVVHQLVQYLKEGALGHKFKKVVLNGNSLGGMVAWYAASQHQSADAVIVSGVGHNFSELALKAVLSAVQPVEENPRYGRGLGWKPGYLVRTLTPTAPESGHDWYTEYLGDTVTIAELQTLMDASRDYSITRNIKVPVLFAMGHHDVRWCTTTGDCTTDPVFTTESSYYGPLARFESFIVPNSGHLTNKSLGAKVFYEKIDTWLHSHGL